MRWCCVAALTLPFLVGCASSSGGDGDCISHYGTRRQRAHQGGPAGTSCASVSTLG